MLSVSKTIVTEPNIKPSGVWLCLQVSIYGLAKGSKLLTASPFWL